MSFPADAADTGLFRSTAVYGTSNVIQKLIPFLLLPVTTRYLTSTDFGIMAVFTVIVSLTTPFTGLNTSYAIARKYFDQEDTHFPSYVANCLGIVAFGATLTAMVVWPLGSLIAAMTGLPTQWSLAAVALSAGQVVIQIQLTIWQVQQKAVRYALLQIARSVYNAGLTLFLVVVVGQNWEGPLTARIATTGTFVVLIGAPLLYGWVTPRYDRNYAMHALRYGGGLIPHTLAALVVTGADRFFISHYAGVSETGLYSVGYQIGFIVSLGADAFNRAWSPWLYARLKENNEAINLRVVRLTYLSFGAIALLALLIAAMAPFIVHVFLGPEFSGSAAFVSWIAVGFAFNGMYRLVAGYVFFSEQTTTLSWISGSAAIANLVLNSLLVPKYGALGAAQATTATFLISFLVTWFAASRIHPMPWNLRLRSS